LPDQAAEGVFWDRSGCCLRRSVNQVYCKAGIYDPHQCKLRMSPYLLTALAMLAFAANSVFCRMALGEGAIDAASFTAIRLLSGAVTLGIILLYRNRGFKREKINILSASMLFIYAICFSFSYIELSTGAGALILFGTVQLTMILYGLIKGERPGRLAWVGIIAAGGGLVYLLMPSISAPPFFSASLMMVAGLAWGAYSLRGKGVSDPVTTTSWNFIATIPMVLLSALIFHADASVSTKGITLAILSGALASGIGYAIWYSALPGLTPTRAATVQLSVPVIAALGGVMFMAEPVSVRLVVSSIVVLGGVYLTIRPVSRQ
jgi:drug/metabolite transporter (DMT)-like permease